MVKFAFVTLHENSATKWYHRVPPNIDGAHVFQTTENSTNQIYVHAHHSASLFSTLIY